MGGRILNLPVVIRLPLPGRGEHLVIASDGALVGVEGVNADRGVGWDVGAFATWAEAMDAARAHQAEEVEFHHSIRGAP